MHFLIIDLNSRIKNIDKNKKIIDNIGKKADEIKKHYSEFNFNLALNEILSISDIGNKYFQENEPWALIKKDKKMNSNASHTFCYSLLFLSNIRSNLAIFVCSRSLPRVAIIAYLWAEIIQRLSGTVKSIARAIFLCVEEFFNIFINYLRLYVD